MKFRVVFSTMLLLGAIVALSAPPAQASFHLMQIEQVTAGVDGDNTAQAIQLRMRSSFQNLVQNSRVVAWDASGANPVVLSTPGSSVPNHGVGVRVLIASANFASTTAPAAVPDFVMSNLIPASYLAAGSLTFENSLGSVVYWRISLGGGGYTGPTTGAITNDADGEFGPAFGGPMPSADTQALLFLGGGAALSTNNAADYALTGSDAVFTNNAGTSFTVESTASGLRPNALRPALRQNHPNPFNPSTTISFSMPTPGHVTLGVFDAKGRRVAFLLDAEVGEGVSEIVWDGRTADGRVAGSGVYFYRLTTARGDQTRKMVLLK